MHDDDYKSDFAVFSDDSGELFDILSDGLVWDETQHKYVYEDDWVPNPNIVTKEN